MSEEIKEKDNQELAQDMVDRLEISRDLYQKFAKTFSSRYYVDDKSLDEWRRYFRVDVPSDLNPEMARHLSMRLMELYQEACYFKTQAEMKLHYANSSNKSRYREKFNDLLVGYKMGDKRIPSRETINTEAEAHIGKELDSVAHIEIELSFWKGILASLQECRKLVETATWNLSVEAKAIGYEARTEGMNKKEY